MQEKSVGAPIGSTTTGCAGCENRERREFVQTAVASVAALIGLTMFSTNDATAQVSSISGVSTATPGVTMYAIPAADGASIDTGNDVMIARAADKVFAFALQCPHQNTALRWNAKDHRFQCPKHKSRYAASGEFIDGRATRNMDRLAIKMEGSSLAVDVTREIRSDQNASAWAAAFVHLTA